MSTRTLNHGTVGRCGCGAVGKRRTPFAGEPICSRCMPLRSGSLRVIDVARDFVVGTLTPSQRAARKRALA